MCEGVSYEFALFKKGFLSSPHAWRYILYVAKIKTFATFSTNQTEIKKNGKYRYKSNNHLVIKRSC